MLIRNLIPYFFRMWMLRAMKLRNSFMSTDSKNRACSFCVPLLVVSENTTVLVAISFSIV